MRIQVLPCLLVLLAGHAASAQDKPDFSGEWILLSSTDGDVNAAQAMTVRESFVAESARGTPLSSPVITLSVERRSNCTANSQSYTVGTISGVVSGTVSGQRQHTSVSTTWDANTLVIDTTYSDVDAGGYRWSNCPATTITLSPIVPIAKAPGGGLYQARVVAEPCERGFKASIRSLVFLTTRSAVGTEVKHDPFPDFFADSEKKAILAAEAHFKLWATIQRGFSD